MPGGIYDQHPDMLDRFLYILGKQEEHREKEEAERKRRMGGPKSRGKMSSRPTY
jgi:hypothetical protein